MLINNRELPSWFEYPSEYSILVKQNLLDFKPWVILDESLIEKKLSGLKKRYPSRSLVPFANREDNDDVACFEKGKKGKVVIIHDFASPRFEGGNEEIDFWDWLRLVLEEMIEYNS